MEKIKATDIINSIGDDSNNVAEVRISDDITINIDRTLDLHDMIAFEKYVVSSCFDDDTNEYMPEIKDFATRCAIYEFYTDVDLPGDTEEAYKFVYSTGDILDSIMNSINRSQFNSIMESIDEKIRSIVEANISVAHEQIDEAFNLIKSMQKQFEDILGNYDKGALDALVSAVVDGKIDETKLASEYYKQRTGSGK